MKYKTGMSYGLKEQNRDSTNSAVSFMRRVFLASKMSLGVFFLGIILVTVGCNASRKTTSTSSNLALPPSTAGSALLPLDEESGAQTGEVHRISAQNMNIVDAVGIAIARHPDIGRATAVVVESNAQISIEKAAWYPTIQYGVSPGYSRYYGTNNRNNNSTVQGTIGANQLIYDFGRTSSRIATARAVYEKERFALADVIENVAANTASIFVELAAAQDLIAAAEREHGAMMRTRERIAERVASGLSDAVDLNQADLAIQRARTDLLSAQTRYDVAAGRFAEITGVRPSKVMDLDATASFVESLNKGGRSINNTPTVLAAEAEVKAAEERVKAARAQLFPAVGLSVSQQKATGGRNVSNDSSFVGLQLSGNLNSGFRERHMITAAQAQLDAARLSSEHERLVARTALGSAETEAVGANARMDNSRQLVSLSLTSRDLYWQQYTLNRRPLTDVVNAERDTFMAESDYISAMADRINARIRAYYAVGELVERLRGK